jgi:acetylornithine deacetylase/succinyl-diaminopimelate desuccinylase-like protein
MGDPACWSHLFCEDDDTDESSSMKNSKPAVKAKGTIPSDLEDFLRKNDSRIHDELFEFLRIPSVSAKSEHNADTKRAAEWVKTSLDKIGVPATIYPTEGHPIVVGEWRKAPGAPTVLIYGHYDVQPAEPLELWTSPPFEPTVRDGKIFARGSVDDKGQLFLHIKALEAHLATRKKLPINVIVIAEGEEEVGSDHLAEFVEEKKALLKADAVVISDSAMFAPGLPSILSSLRGLAYFEITVQGPSSDLHSGSYGGAVVNPAMALARILATFHDKDGRIAISGFYKKVREWDPKIRKQMRSLPFNDKTLMKETGVDALGGEKGYTTLEKLWIRPTCEVNGLLSGYTGEGAKTVLPAKAMAKVSCRPRRTSVARRAQWFDLRCCAEGTARGVREGARDHGRGRIDPRRRRFREDTWRAGAAGRIWSPGRKCARARRVDERREFPAGDARRRRTVGRVREGVNGVRD